MTRFVKGLSDKAGFRNFLFAGIKFRILQKTGNILTNWDATRFSKRVMMCEVNSQ